MKFKDQPREVASEVDPRDDVRVATNRCPFCHDDIAVQTLDWVSCASCQARHHDACWDEGGACGSCGGEKRLIPEAGTLDTSVAAAEEGSPLQTAAGVIFSVGLGAVLMYGNSSPAGSRLFWWLGLLWFCAPVLLVVQWLLQQRVPDE